MYLIHLFYHARIVESPFMLTILLFLFAAKSSVICRKIVHFFIFFQSIGASFASFSESQKENLLNMRRHET